ncbi:MAG: DUF6597 domain-containing transcriptional factor [Crocinitomicaceae bacterium]
MNFDIFEPNKDLAPLIKCYWNLESPKEKTPQKNTIVPDGSMKMIFHYGDPYLHHTEDEKIIELERSLLIGQLTKPFIVEPAGETKTFFVCFHPNGFLPFAPYPIKEMENKAIPLANVFGADGAELGQKILEPNTPESRIEIVESFLLDRLKNSTVADRIINSTVDTILTANG